MRTGSFDWHNPQTQKSANAQPGTGRSQDEIDRLLA
jgi:hypothetical protein